MHPSGAWIEKRRERRVCGTRLASTQSANGVLIGASNDLICLHVFDLEKKIALVGESSIFACLVTDVRMDLRGCDIYLQVEAPKYTS